MKLTEVNRFPFFWASCLGCGRRMGSKNEKIHADSEGSPFRSYYCEDCATTLTEERATLLAEQADFVRKHTA